MIIYFIIPLAVGVSLALLYQLYNKKNLQKESKMNKNNFIIQDHLFSIIISFVVVILLYSLVILLNVFSEIELIVNIILFPILIIVPIGCLSVIREKIIVTNETIKHISVFGKSKIYHWNDIKKIIIITYTNGLTNYKVYSQKRLFSFSSMKIGHNLFMLKCQDYDIEIIKKNK